MKRNTNYYGSYSEFLETLRESQNFLEQNSLLSQSAFHSLAYGELKEIRDFTPRHTRKEDQLSTLFSQIGRSVVTRLQKPLLRPKVTLTLNDSDAYSIQLKNYKQ